MLIDIRISELYNEFKNNNLFLIIIISIFTYLILFPLLPFELNISNLYVYTYNTYNFIWNNFNINYINNFYVISNLWDGNILEADHIKSLGSILYTYFNIWLILTSFILLLAMTGAIIVTIKK